MCKDILSKIDQPKLREVAQLFQLDLIVLFGSYAKGTARSDSDIDFAVHTTRPGSTRRRESHEAAWKISLLTDLSTVIEAPEGIDMIILNGADSLLLFEVATYGIPVYQQESVTFQQFQSYAALRFYDDVKFRRLEREYLKRRFLIGKI